MVRDVITHLLFAEDVVQNATGLANIDAGEILFIDAGGNPLDATALGNLADDALFYIVEGKKGTALSHIISPRLTKASLTAHRGSSYAAEVQQVSYIGDNGTTGDINVLNNTEYSLIVSFGYDKDIYSQRRNVRRYHYTSDATATSAEITAAFVALMNADKDFARQAVAVVETGGGANGIKVTGKDLVDNKIDNPRLVSFTLSLDEGFDATVGIDENTILYVNGASGALASGASVSPKPGIGDYQRLQAMERNGLGFTAGQTNLRKFPVVGPDARVDTAGTYDMYVLDYYNEHENGEIGLGATRKVHAQIIIANNIATTVNGTTAALEAKLLAATGVAVNL
tara:strand:- start:8661 stop:9683 length:1023 start_codon:yes stop_codon:yes gene_type:complete